MSEGKGQISFHDYGDGTRLQIISYRSHINGGRERFQPYLDRLEDLLIETGAFEIERCVVRSSYCDDFIPDAVSMLYMVSSVEHSCNELMPTERYDTLDPVVATRIVKNWRIGSSTSFAECYFYPMAHHSIRGFSKPYSPSRKSSHYYIQRDCPTETNLIYAT